MRKTKKILSILLSCLMLMSMLSVGVFADGTRDNPIDAKTKWFGYGADTYLLNPTIAAGNTDGIWYTLTAEQAGILFLEHSYKNVDYTIYVTVNGIVYKGGCIDGKPYNRPIHTYPLAVGDVATVQIVTKDAAAGTVYANMNIITDTSSNSIKVKTTDYPIYIGAGQTVYYQDDSLNAEYATKYVTLDGDSVKDITLYSIVTNANTGTVNTQGTFTDTDGDNVIEARLGGSEGAAGAPAVKPAWVIENNSGENRRFVLTVVDSAHECVWDDDDDVDCNTCGAERETELPCTHAYDNNCDATCNLCGAERSDVPHYPVGDYDCDRLCCVCWADLSTAEHVYEFELDADCAVCGAAREIDYPMEFNGWSISEDVNGLACRFDLTVEGIKANATTAIYDNATFAGMKLVGMGAIVCNNFEETGIKPTHEDADGLHVTDVPVKYLYSVNGDEVSFAVRIVNIPENGKDTTVFFRPYVILEDDEGNQYTQYIDSWAASNSYNEVVG